MLASSLAVPALLLPHILPTSDLLGVRVHLDLILVGVKLS